MLTLSFIDLGRVSLPLPINSGDTSNVSRSPLAPARAHSSTPVGRRADVPPSVESPQLRQVFHRPDVFVLRVAILVVIFVEAFDRGLLDDHLVEAPARRAGRRRERYRGDRFVDYSTAVVGSSRVHPLHDHITEDLTQPFALDAKERQSRRPVGS